ncbi:MAG TPA: MBL fold metallo-hydrolase [Propionibacteriaceae bacterium]|nr:MBL fold metallo-hydrolase [Propionibacteriaceae bacterium]
MTVQRGTTLTFLGAAGAVTGSKYLLTLGGDGRRILIDAGMFQGEKALRQLNWAPFPVPPDTIGDIILTHAHMDHSGYLPALVKQGFTGHIWCTPATAELAAIVLRDAANLQERDAEHAAERGYSKHHPPLPLYDTADAERTIPLFRTIRFDEPHDLGDGLVVRLVRAGHILGSASVHLTTPDGTVLVSGDLGRPDHPVLKPRKIPPGADYVLVESTYGDRDHPSPLNLPHEQLADAIRRTAERGGSVLVPAFAVDRTEIVLKTLAEMQRTGRIPQLPIYVDSPMALAALRVYRQAAHAGELRPEVDVKSFTDLANLREVTAVEESIKLNSPTMPSIIISSSGMATGGRVLHHLEHMLPDHRNTVVLTGFQAAGTRGRALIEGQRQLKMYGSYVPVRAEILQDEEFSVHASGRELIDWVAALDPRPHQVFCVHGEPDSAAALAERIGRELGVHATVPRMGETIRITATNASRAARVAATAPVTPRPAAATQPVGAAPTPPTAVTWGGRPVTGASVTTDLHWNPDAGDAETLVLEGRITIHLERPGG